MATSFPFENFDVLVGSDPDQQMFTVPHALLSSLKPVDLSEEDPDIFAAYLYCVYHDEVTPVARDEGGVQRYDYLIELYTLADRLMDFTTADLVIDKIISSVHEMMLLPGLEDIKLVYDTTIEGSPLRRLFVDYCVFSEAGRLSGPKHEYPHEYLEEVVEMFMAFKGLIKDVYRPDPDDTSDYHRDAHAELLSYLASALLI